MTSLNAALVGCGFFGRALADGLATIPDVQLTAVADVFSEAAERTALAVGAAPMTLDEILADDAIDVVVVATPNDSHLDPVLAACAAGKHVFVEKPMALNTVDCEAMSAAAGRAGVQLVVGHILRTLPGSERLKASVQSGRLGTLIAAHGSLARWVRPTDAPADWWKSNPSRTGGELLHEIHVLDLLAWLLGEIDDVTGLSTEAGSVVALRAGDLVASYELSRASRIPSWGVTVQGSLATATLDLRAGTLTVLSDAGHDTSDVFDDAAANESLRDFAQRPQGYNRAGKPADLWMQRAIELELASAVEVFRGSRTSPLLEAPARAVGIAERLLSGEISRRSPAVAL